VLREGRAGGEHGDQHGGDHAEGGERPAAAPPYRWVRNRCHGCLIGALRSYLKEPVSR
jgi:hypothetical protein